MARYRSAGLPVYESTGARWAIPLILSAGGFVGGVMIAVFYNVVLSPVPADSIQRAPEVTMTGPFPAPAEPTRSYPSIGDVFRAPTTDGRGGSGAADTPEARARAQAARLEKIRIDKIMQICTGC